MLTQHLLNLSCAQKVNSGCRACQSGCQVYLYCMRLKALQCDGCIFQSLNKLSVLCLASRGSRK